MTEQPFVEDMDDRPECEPVTERNKAIYALVFSDLPAEEKQVTFRKVFTVLPSKDHCLVLDEKGNRIGGCGFWKPTEEVTRRMRDNNRVPSEAFCRCPTDADLEREQTLAMGKAIYDANLPSNGRPQTFDTFNASLQPAGFKAVTELVEGKADYSMVVLWGSKGTGKSHLLRAAARWMLKNNQRPRYIEVPDFVDEFRRAAIGEHPKGFNEWALTEWYQTFGCVMLDDLDMERPTDFSVEKITRFVDKAINSGRKVILSTNLVEKEMEQKYHPRLASRLFDTQTGVVKPVAMRGKDRRLVK